MTKFGFRLRDLRRKKGLSMQEMAKAISVPLSTYREWEYGRAITGEPYPLIASVLGVSLNELFGLKRTTEESVFQRVDSIEREVRELRVLLETMF